MASYYYLVASLPGLDLENISSKLDLNDIYENIRVNIEKEDLGYLQELLYLNDIKNLVNTISANHQFPVPYTSFISPYNFDEDFIREYHLNTDLFPVFMRQVLEEHEERFHSMNPLQIENLFLQAYYEVEGESTNTFLRLQTAFDLHLNNIIAAINSRKAGKTIESQLLEDPETTTFLIKSSARDFGLSDKFEYISELEELIENAQITQLELYVDKLRWVHCDALTSASFFSIDNLLAYVIKLIIFKRRIDLDAEAGRARLKELTDKALTQLEIPEG